MPLAVFHVELGEGIGRTQVRSRAWELTSRKWTVAPRKRSTWSVVSLTAATGTSVLTVDSRLGPRLVSRGHRHQRQEGAADGGPRSSRPRTVVSPWWSIHPMASAEPRVDALAAVARSRCLATGSAVATRMRSVDAWMRGWRLPGLPGLMALHAARAWPEPRRWRVPRGTRSGSLDAPEVVAC
jgi:hypothetical protein